MNITNYGCFVLESEQNEYKLKTGPNLVCVHNNYIDDCDECADCILLINIGEDCATLFRIYGVISVLSETMVSTKIFDNLYFHAGNAKLHFIFRHSSDKLEELVDCFMDGNLTFTLDMNTIFYQYAKQLKITDKKAISNVMAVIDIPEIDSL